ncbi:hypothetical protein QJQ45_008097 [Haematococcus lacustris]|nr:hypothetical protein QJQ45_008097 [Haematococcus lacustris]
MVLNGKSTVSEEQNERHKRILVTLLKEPGNRQCCDCGVRNPTWASINLGVFMCLTCSGIHRSLGVHISQVRSVNLDTWLPRQVEYCKAMGNSKGNRYWEARLPPNFRRPPSGNPNPELARFIREKYEERRYAATDVNGPPTIDNWLSHPYARPDNDNAAGAEQTFSTPAPSPPTQLILAAPAGSSALPKPPPSTAQSAPLPPAPVMPQLTDLLGGFDELLGVPASQPSEAAAATAAAFDPFDALSQPVSAANTSVPGSLSRVSLDWTDFHGPAIPSHTAPSPSMAAAPHSHSQPQLSQPQRDVSNDPFLQVNDSLQAMSFTQPLQKKCSQPQPSAISTGGAMPASTVPGHHIPAKSADEILRLFDEAPRHSAGSEFGDFVAGSMMVGHRQQAYHPGMGNSHLQ